MSLMSVVLRLEKRSPAPVPLTDDEKTNKGLLIICAQTILEKSIVNVGCLRLQRL